uniref:Uncharacterized protein n=1 Tax=viral metagenome TaxID=1070528 RepID=A0A6C0IXB3_9ZZZZ
MSGNGLQNHVNNQNGWNWWPSTQPRPARNRGWDLEPVDQQGQQHWWNGPWNSQGRDQWDQWWQQRNGQQPTRRQPAQWNGRQQKRRRDYDRQRHDDYEQADWDRFYLTGRPLRDIVILVDQRGRIYILVKRQLLKVQTDHRGRIRIHRDRRGRVWIMVRPVKLRQQPQLRTQASLADLARANGVEAADY